MSRKTLWIIIGIMAMLCVAGYYLFPVVMVIFKAIIGLNIFILIAAGFFIGYLLSKIIK
jgi:hypothetical protein